MVNSSRHSRQTLCHGCQTYVVKADHACDGIAAVSKVYAWNTVREPEAHHDPISQEWTELEAEEENTPEAA